MCSQSNKQIINRFYSDQPRSHEYIFAFFHTVMACDQPIADRGPCDSSLPRWTYHKSMNKCVVFTYGGCMGNRNNFRTRHECNYNCAQIVRKASRLHLPPAYKGKHDEIPLCKQKKYKKNDPKFKKWVKPRMDCIM